jgi:acyl-CoA thioesterase
MPSIHPIAAHMLAHDAFSRWLGVELLAAGPGTCELAMTARPEMLNGFGLLHGGICYSLADSALAFASNSPGRHALSVATSIRHLAPCRAGDRLRASALELGRSERVAHYEVRVRDQADRLVAVFTGTVHRRSQTWELP